MLPDARALSLYWFARLRLPRVALPADAFARHLDRAFAYAATPRGTPEERAAFTPPSAHHFLERVYPLDGYLAFACLENDKSAWETLFATRTQGEGLLYESLNRAAREFYPRDEGARDEAVASFWGGLLVSDADGRPAPLARYDALRPLVPWLITVFRNDNLTLIRRQSTRRKHYAPMDPEAPLPAETRAVDRAERPWFEAYRKAASEWLDGLTPDQLLLLGLRWTCRLDQREIAKLIGKHEGTVSRRFDQLSKAESEAVRGALERVGWDGEDVGEFRDVEMIDALQSDERLSLASVRRLLGRDPV